MVAIGLTLLTVLIVLLGVALVAVRGQSSDIRSVEQVTKLSRPVDLESLRNLISEADENYLRAALRGRDYRRVERARMRAAMDYVGRAAHNSAMLLRLGEAGRRSSNSQLAKAGDELANSALHMRLLCMTAMAIIGVRIVLPQLQVSAGSICDAYASTRDRVATFGRIEKPALASRVDAAL